MRIPEKMWGWKRDGEIAKIASIAKIVNLEMPNRKIFSGTWIASKSSSAKEFNSQLSFGNSWMQIVTGF
jgi:hypothetical protein